MITPNPGKPHIAIYATGGTIDKIYSYHTATLVVDEPATIQLMSRANVACDYTIHSVLRKDSLEINQHDRHTLAQMIQDEHLNHIIVTHGTDTMLDTAQYLIRSGGIADKVIVFTGAIYPYAIKGSEAEFNIGFALSTVQLASPGVYIAMNGRVFDPFTSQKNVEKQQFETIVS